MIPCCSSVSAKPAVGRAGSAPLIRRDFGLRPLPNADSLGDVATFFGALLSRKRSPYDSAWQAGEQWAAVVENFRTRPRHVDLSSRYIRIPAVNSLRESPLIDATRWSELQLFLRSSGRGDGARLLRYGS